MTSPEPDATIDNAIANTAEITTVVSRIRQAMRTVIEGKDAQIDLAITVLLAEGHLLVEDVPGVGKTMLAKALAKSIAVSANRLQFTPDLLPSDITGVSVFNQQTREFEFKRGSIFSNIVIGDEINRASPKTQSALLEAMAEGQVSVDGTTYRLPRPFMVVATQNPIEMEGTYPLPEAQRDRFMARITMGYPPRNAELDMLSTHGTVDALATLSPVTDEATMNRIIEQVRQVYVAKPIKDYIVSIVESTRSSQDLRLGASPRASLHLLRAARASAALQERDYVIPEDVEALTGPVLSHRVLATPAAQLSGAKIDDIVRRATATVPAPEAR